MRQDIRTAIDRALQTSTGKGFETLAQEVLRSKYPDLQPILPHGRDGDGGNDAYIRSAGYYFQIHGTAPSTLPGAAAARKVQRDFTRVMKCWAGVSPPKAFGYVANSLGSNIHLERVFQSIRDEHGVEVELVDRKTLSDWMLVMPPHDLGRLTGCTVEGSKAAEPSPLDAASLLALSTGDLVGLHLLAAIVHPLPPKLCEELLADVTDWRCLIRLALGRGWVIRKRGLLYLDDAVARQLRRNAAEQAKACERWAEVLAAHGTVDCLYLSATPLVTLGRLADAARALTRAGLVCGDDGWAHSILQLIDVLDRPKVLRRLGGPDRRSLRLARARLRLLGGDAAHAADALAVYEKELTETSPLPDGINRGRMMIDHGVFACEAGDATRGREVFDRALRWGRRHGDDWVIGRAATNAAQHLAADDVDAAERLLNEGAAAKVRCGDDLGRIGVSMVMGNIAAARGDFDAARGHFRAALASQNECGTTEGRANILFNLAKSEEDAGSPGRAAVNYRRSFAEASKRGDVHDAARAKNGLAATSYARSRWDECREVCGYLRDLPADEEGLADFRLAGLHGLILLAAREGGVGAGVGREVGAALRYARKFDRQDWIVRLAVDPAEIRTSGELTRADLKRMMGVARVELDNGRLRSSALVADAVWRRCIRTGTAPALGDNAEAVLTAAIDGGFDAVDVLKDQYALLMEVGKLWPAVGALATAARIARERERWDDCAALTDQWGVTLQGLDQGESAAGLHREAYGIARKHGDREQVARSAGNLAECYRRLGRFRMADKYSRVALDHSSPSQDAAGFVWALHNRYLIERDLLEPGADATLRRCERLARKHGLTSETMKAIMARGNEAWDRGHFGRARDHFRRAREVGAAEAHGSERAACRYNEAMVLRKLGRVGEALELVRGAADLPAADPLHIDMLRLHAQLSDEAGEPGRAGKLWSHAAFAARSARRAGEAAYFAARAELLRGHAGMSVAERAGVADEADELLLAVQTVPDRGTAWQDAYDRAGAYYKRHGLTDYAVVLNRVFADRLSFGGATPDHFAAAKASTASILAGVEDAALVRYAAELHVRWIVATGLSARQLRRLKGRLSKWLSSQVNGGLGQDGVAILLSGFDAVADGLESRLSLHHRNR